MSNYALPESLADDYDLMCYIRSTMTYVSAQTDREFFIRNLRILLTGDIDDMLAARDEINMRMRRDCDEYEELAA